SLGPTAFLLFYASTTPAASPRNTIGGHLIGCLVGYLALVLFGLTSRDPALAVGVDWTNVGAAAFSLAFTRRPLRCAGRPPPAGARRVVVLLAGPPPRALGTRRAHARRRAAGRAGPRAHPPGRSRLSALGATTLSRPTSRTVATAPRRRVVRRSGGVSLSIGR